jgi:DinB superfamily
MADVGNSLTKAFDYAWDRFLGRLEGLGDAEYFWEPVPGCWSVRRGADGRWAMDGGPAPEPAPVTTIAWRIGHIGMALAGFADRLFGAGTLAPQDVELAPSAADAAGFLRASYARGGRASPESVNRAGGSPSAPRSARTRRSPPPTWPCTSSTNSSTTPRRSACSGTSTCARTNQAGRHGHRPAQIGPGAAAEVQAGGGPASSAWAVV